MSFEPISWTRRLGKVNELSAGHDGSLWAVSKSLRAGGFKIYEWNFETERWDDRDEGAIKIAVGNYGKPYMIKDDNKMYTVDESGLRQLPGRAREIAIGGLNDDLYAIGTNKVQGGYGIYKWDGGRWARQPGGAMKIEVGAYNLNDTIVTVPVAATEDCRFYYMWNEQWKKIDFEYPEGGVATSCDISLGPEGSLYVIVDDRIYKQDPSTKQFTEMGGRAKQILVSTNGKPIAITSNGRVYWPDEDCAGQPDPV
jgi:hypothetical protein